jgi:hypothetical protein
MELGGGIGAAQARSVTHAIRASYGEPLGCYVARVTMKPPDLSRMIVGTTVQPKNVMFPTDAKFLPDRVPMFPGLTVSLAFVTPAHQALIEIAREATNYFLHRLGRLALSEQVCDFAYGSFPVDKRKDTSGVGAYLHAFRAPWDPLVAIDGCARRLRPETLAFDQMGAGVMLRDDLQQLGRTRRYAFWLFRASAHLARRCQIAHMALKTPRGTVAA